MKKRGFTLVELLAVLVLIAAISLIIFPSIINYINGSKNDISDTSKNLIFESTKLYVDNNKNSFPEVAGNTYCVTVGELMDNDYLESTFKDTVSGKTIERDKKIKVSLEYDNDLKINKFKYDLDDSCEATTLCKVNTSKVIALVWDGNNNPMHVSSHNREEVGLLASGKNDYTPGVTYTCNVGDGERIFYVLEEKGDNISLILGTNLGNIVAWSSDGNNHKDEDESQQAVTAKSYLAEQTSGWIKLDPSQISLPSAEQIATAAGTTFDSNSSSSVDGLPTWLSSYTDENVAYGYWTSSPYVATSNSAWAVYYNGNIYNRCYVGADNLDGDGIRPVITISKSQLG